MPPRSGHPAPARTYGTLRLVADSNGCRPQGRWEIADLEPHVAIRFKHLFPRVPKESAGPFHLPNDLMHAADLEWFTVRYPLAMTAEDRHVLETGRRGWDLEQAELERILELTRFGGHLRVPTGGSEYGQVQVKMG